MTHKEKYNDTATVDVIIPASRPGTGWKNRNTVPAGFWL